ncbi:MAG: phosphodiester glycosidase family protein [Sumerlaeia bacterium]
MTPRSLSSLSFKLLLCALVCALVVPATAGYNAWTSVNVSPGVVWKNKVYPSLFGGKQTVNVLEVDLTNSAVKVQPLKASSGCSTTSGIAQGFGAVAAINGGFFGSCSSVSMIKINGTVLDTNPGWKPARATLGINQGTDTADIDWIASTNSWSAVNDALGGGPNLVTNGSVNVTQSQEGFDSSYANRNPRTAVGFNNGGKKLFLVTIDGRTSAGAGMTLSELATYMTWLGCTDAMNLDGGGSTTMWTSGNGVVNTPSDGYQRSVVSVLGIFNTGGGSSEEVIVDNGTSGFTASSNWWASSSTSGYYGSNYQVRATASTSDAATWKANLSGGTYKVYARWASGSNRASSAPYVVYHTGGSSTVYKNQQTQGGQWVLLGTYNMAAGNSTRVALSCWTSSGTYVIADAVRLVKQ